MSKKYLPIVKEKGYIVDRNGVVIGSSGKILKLKKDKRKYYTFSVRMDIIKPRHTVTIRVHQYIAYIKYGDEYLRDGIVARHLDSNSLNNKWENIAIGTESQNMMDVPEDLRIAKSKKAAAKLRKFTDKQVDKIRQEHANGDSYDVLYKRWNCAKSTIAFIIQGKTYPKSEPK